MNCSESISLLQLYDHGGLPPDKQVEFGYHWLSCRSCREQFERLRIERDHCEHAAKIPSERVNEPVAC